MHHILNLKVRQKQLLISDKVPLHVHDLLLVILLQDTEVQCEGNVETKEEKR